MGSNYWTLDGMMDSGKKKKKKESKEKKHGKEKDKDKKKKKKTKGANSTLENHSCYSIIKADKKCQPSNNSVYVPYADFLKNDGEGIYVVRALVGDTKLETYIIKSDEFEFPRIALSKSGDSYKDWLRKKLESMDSDVNVNKILYGSSVKKMEVPKGFLAKVIKNSKSSDED